MSFPLLLQDLSAQCKIFDPEIDGNRARAIVVVSAALGNRAGKVPALTSVNRLPQVTGFSPDTQGAEKTFDFNKCVC
jgi:hypothetical protein